MRVVPTPSIGGHGPPFSNEKLPKGNCTVCELARVGTFYFSLLITVNMPCFLTLLALWSTNISIWSFWSKIKELLFFEICPEKCQKWYNYQNLSLNQSIPNLEMVDRIFWPTDFGGRSYRFTHDRPFVSQEFLVETAHTISLILLHETSPVLQLVKNNWRNRNLKNWAKIWPIRSKFA